MFGETPKPILPHPRSAEHGCTPKSKFPSLSLISGFLVCLVMISACPAWAQAPQKTIHSSDGWVVKYGVVDGATTQPAAIVPELRSVAKSCGESPLISKPFRYKGKNTVGVFYAVRDHSRNNAPFTGLILSDFNDQKQVETAWMQDTASRFPSTLKPMMETVFKEWRPAEVKPAATTPPGQAASSGGSPASAALLPMHEVKLQDGTASAKVPDGWQLGAMSHGGTMQIDGPHQERIILNGTMLAQDPRLPAYQRSARMGIRTPAIKVVLPFDTDWVKAFSNLYLTSAHILQWNPTDLTIDHAELLPAAGSQRCVQGKGHVNNFGTGLMELNAIFCPQQPDQPQTGVYRIVAYFSLIPNAYADQERATAAAVVGSFWWTRPRSGGVPTHCQPQSSPRCTREYNDMMGVLRRQTEIEINNIHQIGKRSEILSAEREHERVVNQGQFEQRQEDTRRYGQGFSDYILDQSVIQYTNPYGDVAHQRVSNPTAYNLVQFHSDKVEIVDTPNYIPGTDFSR